MNEVFSIVGLGKLGSSMAAAMAMRGFNVIGVDVNQHTVDLLNSGAAPVQETNLQETITANKSRLRATTDYQDAILNSTLTFVVVPTPSDSRGAFSLKFAAEAFRQIGRALRAKDNYHTVVLASTVLPGATRYGLLPILERESGKTCGRDFGLCFSPEFIALGSVIRDFLNPDFTLIGEYDTQSGDHLEACYAKIMENQPVCKRMSIENAELTKISLNAFVTTKITFANMLADLCERIPGGNVDVVSDALGSDERIGRKYLTGGLGFGGPCFPRDNVALSFVAQSVGVDPEIPKATDSANRKLPDRVVKNLGSVIPLQNASVAVLGLAYKPLSSVTEESQGVQIARALSKAGARVFAYDPLAGANAKEELAGEAEVLDCLSDCVALADTIIITTPDSKFQELEPEDLLKDKAHVTVVDFWRILKTKFDSHKNIQYIPGGEGLEERVGNTLQTLWQNS